MKIYTSIKDEYYCRTSTGQRTPTYKHTKLSDALKEAERLTTKHGCKVEVLKVVAEVSREPVTIMATKIVHTSHVQDEDELPF